MIDEELKPIDVSKYKITKTGQVLKRTKEEIKDEIKNRISFALKGPILQQSFEIICKENAELKETIADIEKALGTRPRKKQSNS